jgi:SAM-dependent methyltransferase
MQTADEAVLEDLRLLARAQRLGDWMFSQFARDVHGSVVEVGAGIGTFSGRLLAAGCDRLVLVEPHPESAAILAETYGGDERVHVVRASLPGAEELSGELARNDLVLSQNVLEHIEDDTAAVAEMASYLRPGGMLDLLVPAHPRLYTRLDREYGHHRRYDRTRLEQVLRDAGLEIVTLRSFNLLGVPGWWLGGRRSSGRIGAGMLRAYELVVPVWRRLEELARPPVGLSLVARARRPS